MFLVLETLENMWGKPGNIVSATKTILNFFEIIFASWEANFVSTTMFPQVGKQGNIDRKHNVFATMFPSLPRALDSYRCACYVTSRITQHIC